MIKLHLSKFIRASRSSVQLRAGLAATACFLSLGGGLRAQATFSSSAGDATLQTSGAGAAAGATPPDGSTSEYLVTTESKASYGSSVSGGAGAVAATTLANYSYLDANQLVYNSNNPGVAGSAVQFTLSTTSVSNNAVQFTYSFATSENVGGGGVNPDFGYYAFTPVDTNGLATGATTYGLLGSAGDVAGSFSTITDPNANSPFNLVESYQTFTLPNLAVGNYVLTLGVADANATNTQSGLFVGSVNQVPEPNGALLLVLGVVGFGAVWVSRRRGVVRGEG